MAVEQDGTEQDSFVYEVNRQQETNASLITSWTTFSISDTVTVTVTKLSEGATVTCEVLPSSFDIQTEASGNDCTFTLDRPRKVSVDLDGDIVQEDQHTLYALGLGEQVASMPYWTAPFGIPGGGCLVLNLLRQIPPEAERAVPVRAVPPAPGRRARRL